MSADINQCTYISLAISTAFSWIAFAIDIALTMRARSKVHDFETTPDQHVSLRIGPTSWIALAGAVSPTHILLSRYNAEALDRIDDRFIVVDIQTLDLARPTRTSSTGATEDTEGNGFRITGINQVNGVLHPNQLAATESCLRLSSCR